MLFTSERDWTSVFILMQFCGKQGILNYFYQACTAEVLIFFSNKCYHILLAISFTQLPTTYPRSSSNVLFLQTLHQESVAALLNVLETSLKQKYISVYTSHIRDDEVDKNEENITRVKSNTNFEAGLLAFYRRISKDEITGTEPIVPMKTQLCSGCRVRKHYYTFQSWHKFCFRYTRYIAPGRDYFQDDKNYITGLFVALHHTYSIAILLALSLQIYTHSENNHRLANVRYSVC